MALLPVGTQKITLEWQKKRRSITLSKALAYCNILQFAYLLALGAMMAMAAGAVGTGSAYAHGCQAQGACCEVGGSCAEITAVSPVYMMFAVIGVGAVAMLGFYGRQGPETRLGAIFNIFR
jgi:hypothetical protein